MRKFISSLLAATIMASSMFFSGGQAMAEAPYCQLLDPSPDSPGAAKLKELLKKTSNPDEIVAELLDPVAPMKPEDMEKIYGDVFKFILNKYIDADGTKLKHLSAYEHKYDGKLATRKDLDAAIADLVGSMDDRWTWVTSASDKMEQILRYVSKQVSFGINLRKQPDGSFRIEHVTYGSTAQFSGLREDDTVIAVNDKPLAGMTKAEAEKLLAGPIGAQVKIKSLQDGKEVEASYSLKAPVPNDAGAKLLKNNLAYLKLPSFMDHKAFGELMNSMAGMAATTPGGLQGIILDLRYNGGGEVDMAKTLIRLLMSEGVVIQELSRDGRERVETKTTVLPLGAYDELTMGAEQVALLKSLQKLPLVILINGSSASASEITTGALMESRPNTVVLGERSFGKFTEMLVTDLPNCSRIAVTSGRYTTPSGKWLQDTGITPGIIVHQPRGSQEDAQMAAAIEYLETLTGMNPANVVQKAPDDKAYLGPVPVRPQPEAADTDYAQLARENRTLLMQIGTGVGLFGILGIYLLLSRRRKDDEESN